MTLESLAIKVVEATEAAGVDFMVVGAIAAGAYGVPRSTKDVDLLVAVSVTGGVAAVIQSLAPLVEFEPQVVFDADVGATASGAEPVHAPLQGGIV